MLNMGADMKSLQTKPNLAEVELTTACNARCVFCPRHMIGSPVYMKEDVFRIVVERLVEAGIEDVKFAGFGEPTMHPSLTTFLRLLRKRGRRPQLNTNGSLLDCWKLEEILELCEEIIISLHTLDRTEHHRIFRVDFYDRVMANFNRLLDVNQRFMRKITVYAVLTCLNPKAVKMLHKYAGLVSLRLSGCSNRIVEGFADEIIDLQASESYNHYPQVSDSNSICGYALATSVIDCHGRYLLCTNDALKQTKTGFVQDTSIVDAYDHFVKGMISGSFLPICRKCENHEDYRRRLERRS